MKKTVKVIQTGCAVLVIGFLLMAGLFVYGFFGVNTYETQDIAYYQAISGELNAPNSLPILGEQIDIPPCPYELPYISELENYGDYDFHYMARRYGIFNAHAYILVVSYPQMNYLLEKDALNTRYIWLTDKVRGESEGISPKFNLDGFLFQAVEGGYYPKEMLLIGTSDENCQIAYIYFWDQDLDYIAPSFDAFVLEETGWDKLMQQIRNQ